MNQVVNTPKLHIAPRTVTRTKLEGQRLLGARILWLAAVSFALFLFYVGISARFAENTRGFLGLDWSVAANGEILLLPSPGMAAAQAGLQTGDVLLALNGQALTSPMPQTRIQQLLNDPNFARVTFQVRHPDGTMARYVVARDTRGLDQAGIAVEIYARYNVALDLLLVLSFTALALLIFLRRGDDWFALLMAGSLVYFAVRIPPEIYTLILLEPKWTVPVNIFLIASRTLLILWLCLFPNGRFVPRAARWLAVTAFAYYIYSTIAYDPSARTYYASSEFLVDGAFIILGILAQVYRYRRSSGVREKLQTRWVLFGVTGAFVVYYLMQFLQSRIPGLNIVSADYYRFEIITQPILYLALMLVPLTMTISILRYHLWQIDVLVNRTLVYLPLTAILAGILAGSMSLAQGFFQALTGQGSGFATALATLVIVALFEPLKKLLQEFVDRHFKEAGDPASRLKPFEALLRARIYQIDLPALTRHCLQEAVKAFDAESGHIFVQNGAGAPCEFTIGDWQAEGQMTAPLLYAEKQLGNLALGARTSLDEYDARDRMAFEHLANLMAQTLAESRAG